MFDVVDATAYIHTRKPYGVEEKSGGCTPGMIEPVVVGADAKDTVGEALKKGGGRDELSQSSRDHAA